MKIINLEKVIPNKQIREWVEALIFAVVVALIFRTWIFAPYRVPTGSMVHTIEVGDHIFVSKFAYGLVIPFTGEKLFTKKVKRREIVVFPYPNDPSVDYIKRVVALGGDQVELRGEEVYINGKLEEAPHAYYDPTMLSVPEARSFTVPEGKLWVMGDNRRNSKDSRYWGFVDESTVAGRGLIVYWSHDVNESLLSGYRLGRIGKFLE